ncbi:MAG: glycosyltransferase family 4 protein [bacterium]|nr:glycosyltransferase family 4 protein [bacterium]
MNFSVWITWETQRRNSELSKRFGAKRHVMDYSNRGALARYLICIWRTCRLLATRRPRVVFVQSPSIVLALLAVILKRLLSFKVAVDAHNIVIEQALSGKGAVSFIARTGLRWADWVIVSNNALRDSLAGISTNILVIPDPLPDISAGKSGLITRNREYPAVTLICSFASDEPIEDFILASRDCRLPHVLFITGSKKKAGDLLRYESESIRFTGYLAEADFESLISTSDILVDLTTRENCLVCGAYEALAVGVPCILSDTTALRETFPEGFVFTGNNTDDFARALERAIKDRNEMAKGMGQCRTVFEVRWASLFEVAKREIYPGGS